MAPTFPHFELLPMELRLQIWEYAGRAQSPSALSDRLFHTIVAYLNIPSRAVWTCFLRAVPAATTTLMRVARAPRLVSWRQRRMDVEDILVKLVRAFLKGALLNALVDEIGKLREPNRLN